MTFNERNKTLRYLMFIKEKRDGMVEARGCTDGISQREYMTKTETSLCRVLLGAMMMS